MPPSIVLLAEPRGFCAGVEMAIKALTWMVRVFEPPVYCYHEIVHNQIVVRRFEDLGVVFVDDVAEVPPGRPIMLSAHGSAPEVVDAARATGGFVVDAVCPLVTKVHHEVKVRSKRGYDIVYVGHEGHEEAVGTMAVAPHSIHQLPPGMRRSLSLKDDDYRLSFLYGNFTTLTRFTEADLERVVTERLSPLHVSIHATDPEVRSRTGPWGPSISRSVKRSVTSGGCEA